MNQSPLPKPTPTSQPPLPHLPSKPSKPTPLRFEISARQPQTLARAGIIHTAHGDIKTPAFLAVGTFGTVRFIDMSDLHTIRAEGLLSNAYHLRNQAPQIATSGGLATHFGWHGPTVTDSGGFQVMSLGSGHGKVVAMSEHTTNRPRFFKNTDNLVQITDAGVHFTDPFTGQPDFIDPETSMQTQCQIGADIHMAFDELTSLSDTYEYNQQALIRTHAWANRCLSAHNIHRDSLGYRQHLYAVLQGGRWQDLRRQTAQYLGNLPFDGYGLGGAFLKSDLQNILLWCNSELPEAKPRHLLGLSRPEDILIGVEMGCDTFDCVAPTREARHGRIYTRHGFINLRQFAHSDLPLDDPCDCPTCQSGHTRGSLRALWKSGDPVQKSQFYRLASIHNLRFTIRLTADIRASLLSGTFPAFKSAFLSTYRP